MNIIFEKSTYENIQNHKLQAFYLFSKDVQIDNDTYIKLLLDVSDFYKKYSLIEDFLFLLDEKMKDSRPIVLKGLSSYLLTKNPIFIRKCNDLDIISEDNDFLIKTLFALGFVDTHEACDQHEEMKLYSKKYNLLIEVHKHFPVFSRNRGKDVMTYSKITYDVMKNNTYTYISPITNHKITLLNPEMNIIIAASHIYKGFVWQPLEKPPFHFEEVLEVYYLTQHSDFKMDRFLDLIEQCNAKDSLSFVSELISSNIIERNPFSKLNLHYPFEYKIAGGFQNIWREVKNPDFFTSIVNKSSFDMLFMSDNNSCIEPLLHKWMKSKDFKATIYNTNSDSIHDFSFSISKDEKNLLVSIKKNKPIFYEDNITIQFENNFCKAILYGNTNEITQFGRGNIQVRIEENSYTVFFNFPLVDLQETNDIIRIIIISEVNHPECWKQTIVPINIKL